MTDIDDEEADAVEDANISSASPDRRRRRRRRTSDDNYIPPRSQAAAVRKDQWPVRAAVDGVAANEINEGDWPYKNIGAFDQSCLYCGARLWEEEITKHTS